MHFLVPGGGIAPDGESWIACRPGFFLPVPVLSRMFRGLFLHYLEKAFAAGTLHFFSAYRHLHEPAAFRRYLVPVWNTEWVVYAKRPFAGPAQVLDYVGRYVHRVAISRKRLVSIDNGKSLPPGRDPGGRFRWKDYLDGNRQKTMTLDGGAFIRRFLIHVLPDGFHRIRNHGFLGNCHRARKLARCRELLAMAPAGPTADPPVRGEDAVAVNAANVSPGAFEQGSNGQTRSASVARRLGWRGQWRQIATSNARWRSGKEAGRSQRP